MAPTQRVVLLLDLKIGRRFDKSLDDAKRRLQKGFRGFARNLGRVFARATQFRISTIGINAFFNSLKFARTEAIAFQSALANVIKLDIDSFFGLGSAAAARLTETISELSKQFNINRVQAAKSFQTIVTAGFRGQEATKLFETALLAQASAGLTSNNAISLLIATLKQFNLTVGESERALDILLAIQSKAAIGFAEFSGAFRTGGAALAASTESLQQAGALIAALAERTRESGSVVGTFFKTIQARITARRQTRQQIEQLGIDVEVQGRLRPIVDLLEDLRDRLEGINEARKGEILSVIAGIRQVNRLQNVLAALDNVRRLEAEGAKASGEARRRAAIEQQTIAARFNKAQITFVQSLEKQLIPTMSTLTTVAQGAANVVAFLTTSLADFVLHFKPSLLAELAGEEQRRVLARAADRVQQEFNALPKEVQANIIRELSKVEGQIVRAIDSKKLAEALTASIPKEIVNVGGISRLAAQPGAIIRRGPVPAELKPPPLQEFKDFIATAKNTSNSVAQAGFNLSVISRVFTQEFSKAVKDGTLDLEQFKKALAAGGGLAAPGAGETGALPDLVPISEAFAEGLDTVGTQIALSQTRLRNAFDQILDPARKYNDSLTQQRQTLAETTKIQVENQRRGLRAAQEEFDAQVEFQRNRAKAALEAAKAAGRPSEIIRKLEKEVARPLGTIAQSIDLANKKEEVRAFELNKQAELAEFDAGAVRRLNVQLNSLKDKSREATRGVSSQTRRLNELRKEEAKAASAVAEATSNLRNELLSYRVGLIRASIESKTFTGQISGLSQRLKAIEEVVPTVQGQLARGRQSRLAPAFQAQLGATGGAARAVDLEGRLATLRRDSLQEQLSLVQDILNEQRRIGESFFGLDAAGRTQVAQGLNAISQIFGRFGGDIGGFQGLSDDALNAFGRELIGLPTETKDAILEALRFIPEGGTVAGFTADQIRNIIATASIGRATGTGIEDIQDLERRAAEATVKLAELNTDGVSTAIQQLDTANRSLDQQMAQTETAKIQLQVAREQLAATLSGQAERRSLIEKQIAEFRGLSGAGRVPIGETTAQRIAKVQAERVKALETGRARSTVVAGSPEQTGAVIKKQEKTNALLEAMREENKTASEKLTEAIRPIAGGTGLLNNEQVEIFSRLVAENLSKAADEGKLNPGRIEISSDVNQNVLFKVSDIQSLATNINNILANDSRLQRFGNVVEVVGPILTAIVEQGIAQGVLDPGLRQQTARLR